jgi:hypothetical protein
VYLATIATGLVLGACRLFVPLDGIDDGPPVDDAAGVDAPADRAATTDGAGDATDAGDGSLVDVIDAGDTGTDAGPTITFVSASTAAPLTSASAIDLDTPAGVVAGDVILVGLFTDVAATNAATPAGFTKLADLVNAVADIRGWWYVRTAGASEPVKTTFTFDRSTTTAAIAVAYRNVRAASPVDASGFGQSASNPLVAPSITPTVAKTMLVGIYFADDTLVANWFAPAGMTARGSTGICAAFDQLLGAPGATGTRSATNDQNVAAVQGLIALAPKP